jgi:hypothetical protein
MAILSYSCGWQYIIELTYMTIGMGLTMMKRCRIFRPAAAESSTDTRVFVVYYFSRENFCWFFGPWFSCLVLYFLRYYNWVVIFVCFLCPEYLIVHLLLEVGTRRIFVTRWLTPTTIYASWWRESSRPPRNDLEPKWIMQMCALHHLFCLH